MQLGISKNIITPDLGVELAGFGRLGRKAIGKYDDLYLSVFALKQDSSKALIICADIIGFGLEYTKMIKKEIEKLFGYKEQEILLSSSHTHSGPQTLDNMNPYLGHMDADYMVFLTKTILDSIKSAESSMEEVEIYKGKAYCSSIGINRRLITDEKYQFAPNENGPVDKEVTVFKFTSKDTVKAILFNFACHPSTINTDLISADFPGEARRLVEEAFDGKVVTAFMQGCCGNIRVRTMQEGRFKAGTYDDVKAFGKALGNSVLEACNGPMEKITPKLSSNLIKVALQVRELPDKNEYLNIKETGTGYRQLWASQMLENYDHLTTEVPYTIQRISLSDDNMIIGMEGEVCIEYDLYLKNKHADKSVIVSGYCNCIIGYIPTAIMFEQGGYEPSDSIACYSLPTRFTYDIEETIKKSLDKL